MGSVDCHVHLYPPEINRDPAAWAEAAGEPHWATLCTRRRKDGRPVQGFPNLDRLLHDLDVAGIERAVLLGWYWQQPESCRTQNRFYAECVKLHPDRLSAFATLHPGGAPGSVAAEVRRAKDEGFVGLGELSPHSQGCSIGEPGFLAALGIAAELRLPVTLHVSDPEARTHPGRVETPLEDFCRLARDHPGVRFILAHWGGMLPARIPEARSLPNLFYDTAASPLLYDAGVWERFLGVVEPGRVLFGSDHPLDLYPAAGGEPDLGRFADEARRALGPNADAVMGENARRIFCL